VSPPRFVSVEEDRNVRELARVCKPHTIAAGRFGLTERRVDLMNNFFGRSKPPIFCRKS
jgi:hypothetical protein